MENNNKEEKKNVKAAGKKLSYEEMSMALQQYSSQLNMCAKEYGVKMLPAELKACVTIQDVYDLVESKK